MPERPHRVCMVLDLFYPLRDGLGLQALQLSRELTTRGVEVTILTRRIDPATAVDETLDGIRIHRVWPHGSRSNLKSMLEILPMARHLISNRRNFDIIHVQDVRSIFISGLLARWITRKPLIVKVPTQGDVLRQVTESTELTWFSKALRKLLLPNAIWRPLLRQAQGWIATTDAIMHELTECGVSHIAHQIPNGIDTARFHPASPDEKLELRKRLGLPVDHKIIISHGRLDPRKGLHHVIEAMGDLRAQNPNVTLFFPGDVSDVDREYKVRLETLVRERGLQGVVHMPGPVANVQEYLQASDIFVMISEREGLSNAMLEAMASGLSIIASNIGGLSQLIQHEQSGLVVPPGEVDALRDQLERYLTDDALASRMGAGALAAIEENYTSRRVAEQYLALYDNLVGEVRRATPQAQNS